MKTWVVWAGRVISAAPVYICLSSATWKLTHNAWYVREWQRFGWPLGEIEGVAIIQIVCVVLYVIPQTAVLGAILLTGYLGGEQVLRFHITPHFLLYRLRRGRSFRRR